MKNSISDINSSIETSLKIDHSDNIEFIDVQELDVPAKKIKLSKIKELDLKNVLLNHPLGPSLFLYYKSLHCLDTQCQSYLCEIIILHCFKEYGL